MHTEVMGFFLSYYKGHEIHICHKHKASSYNWIETFVNAIGARIQYVKRPVFEAYDKIIFITSRDLAQLVAAGKFNLAPEKVIQIRHTTRNSYAPEYPNISLSPCIPATQGNLLTVVPQLRRPAKQAPSAKTWVFTVVGLSDYSYPKKDVKGLLELIQVLDADGHDYLIKIVSRECKQAKETLSHPRVLFLESLTVQETSDVIQSSHFILPLPKRGGPYYKNLLSGVIPIALSYGVPLLAQYDYLQLHRLNHQCGVMCGLEEISQRLAGDEWYQNACMYSFYDADKEAVRSSMLFNGICAQEATAASFM